MTNFFDIILRELPTQFKLRSAATNIPFDKDLVEITLRSLQRGTFTFSPMKRSFIPKANKPGQFRPITQAAEQDIPLLNTMAFVLANHYESIFLSCSHGFRKGRGMKSFFYDMHLWSAQDKLIKSDVVKCFDFLNHGKLASFLTKDLGRENSYFIDLLCKFMRAPIFDRKGNEYSNTEKGIPQGSSLSPVLMNIFLHRLDLKIHYFAKGEPTFRYARYADDMIFGIGRSEESEKVYRRFSEFFKKSLLSLKLEATSLELFRARRRKTLVLGMVSGLSAEGIIETAVPFNRWNSKLTSRFFAGEMERLIRTDPSYRADLRCFLMVLKLTIVSRISLAFSCCRLKNEKELTGYFTKLSQDRIRDFLGRRRTPSDQRQISRFLSHIEIWIEAYRKSEK